MQEVSALRHVLRSQQFSVEFLRALFQRAWELSSLVRSTDVTDRETLSELLSDHRVITLFYEPSTRTRLSFEAAATYAGATVLSTENAHDFSSAIKGETIKDTIRVLCGYGPDVFIIRHHEAGGAERAAAVSTVPVINAGDGNGQHPTQALLDLYTIWSELDRLDNLQVVIGGDLANGRTARSLAYLLSKFKGVRITFVSPFELRIGDDIKRHLVEHKVDFEEVSPSEPSVIRSHERETPPNKHYASGLIEIPRGSHTLSDVLRGAHVVYWTRVQKERLISMLKACGTGGSDAQLARDADELYRRVQGQFTITPDVMAWMRPDAILMHPLPRVNEITPECDNDPRAAYFRQAANGLPVRLALLEWVLGVATWA